MPAIITQKQPSEGPLEVLVTGFGVSFELAALEEDFVLIITRSAFRSLHGKSIMARSQVTA
jgi:hypothetical protein